MKRSVLIVLSCLLLLPIGCGESKPLGPPLAWRASDSTGGQATLLGTLHRGVSASAVFTRATWDGFNAATTMVAEAETRDIAPTDFFSFAKLPPGQTLDQLVSAETWTELLQLIDGISSYDLRFLRPWVVSSILQDDLMASSAAMDVELLDRAEKQGKQLAFFETWQYQATLLNQIPLVDSAQVLDYLVAHREEVRRQIEELILAYRLGDLDEISRVAELTGAVPPMDDPVFDLLIGQRNFNWLPIIEEHIQNGPAFIAVGFGHLLGPEGLLQDLREKDYQIVRLD